MTPELVIATVAATTALIATIVGPIVSYKIAAKQIRATLVSSNRQIWINELRKLITEYTTSITVFATPSDDATTEQRAEVLYTIHRLKTQIHLLLNHQEESQAQLYNSIHAAAALLPRPGQTPNYPNLHAANNAVLAATHPVLKQESERVQKGK